MWLEQQQRKQQQQQGPGRRPDEEGVRGADRRSVANAALGPQDRRLRLPPGSADARGPRRRRGAAAAKEEPAVGKSQVCPSFVVGEAAQMIWWPVIHMPCILLEYHFVHLNSVSFVCAMFH